MPTTVPSGSLITPGGDQGPSGATSSLATTTAPGLLQQISGNVTDYVGGDNSCHPLPIQVGGVLKYVSATQLSYLPFNGNWIKINGFFYPIPTTGIVGLTNTGCYIDGAIGNLTTGSIYKVYCWNNNGVLTAEFSTTGHSTSLTAGNVGTEIKTGDDSRTLIGMISCASGAIFYDTPQFRFTRSWLNGGRVSFGVAPSVSITATTATITNAQATVLCFANEALSAQAGWYGTSTTAVNVTFTCCLDGSAASTSAITATSTTAKYENASVAGAWHNVVTEGTHVVALYAFNSGANTASGNGYVWGIVG